MLAWLLLAGEIGPLSFLDRSAALLAWQMMHAATSAAPLSVSALLNLLANSLSHSPRANIEQFDDCSADSFKIQFAPSLA